MNEFKDDVMEGGYMQCACGRCCGINFPLEIMKERRGAFGTPRHGQGLELV
jgi:hypothetical protein